MHFETPNLTTQPTKLSGAPSVIETTSHTALENPNPAAKPATPLPTLNKHGDTS